MVRARLAAGATLLTLSACLPIPHTHEERPEGTFVVRDEHGRSVPGARLTVYVAPELVGAVDWDLSLSTSAVDTVRVEGQSRWHMLLIAVPDGEAGTVSTWCADAPGYKPEFRNRWHSADSTIVVILKPGEADVRCDPTAVAYERLTDLPNDPVYQITAPRS